MKDINKFKKLGIVIFVLLLLAGISYAIWLNFFKPPETITLRIGAGKKSSESYAFANAIKKVTEANYENVKIKLITSRGSEDSLSKLESDEVELATVQADVKAGKSAYIISNLYPDYYHLIVRKDSNITSFADLKGKNMALPTKGSGQWISFLFTAKHYGMGIKDVKNFPCFKSDIPSAFNDGMIDAVFVVKAPMNTFVSNLLKTTNTKIITIDQCAALTIKQPALKTTMIPKGIYSGSPAVPSKGIETISVNRLLVAHTGADEEAIKTITSVLFERRLDLLKYTPLAGLVSQPDWNNGTTMPIHPGAMSYYDKDKPSYFEENADFLALLITLALMAGSGLLALKNYLDQSQKNIADQYSKELFDILKDVKKSDDVAYILKKKEYLEKMLEEIIHQLDIDNVTAEGFQFFSFTWDQIYSMVDKKLLDLSQ